MYKKREEYEQMLRLVSKYRKELMSETYKHIAEQYDQKGNLKKAEQYYVEAKMWTSAMAMYRQLEKWEDAKRVAKVHGGKPAFEKVVLAQAQATYRGHGAEAGAQLLAKHGLIETAIDYALDHSNFQHAFELAQHSATHKLPDIHLKKALKHEDDEQFKAAEEEYIQAGKPHETMRARLKEHGKRADLIAKISIALCRYCAEIPVDRAFYEAGVDCKVAKMTNMAFFFLNRFLDIADAIDDPENAAIDNTDFLETDIPSPYDLDLPEEQHICVQQVEDIRDWVLGLSVDHTVQQKMDLRPCDQCRAEIYMATLTCPKCNHQHEPCGVSGLPVLKRSRVECSNCHVAANRDDWNVWLQLIKGCPWCLEPQNAQY
eukprot:NODE_3885_length_1967_cov_5.998370.p1 GENE.NODE_3885_length_1967_cov_5.998370~~NODE_3885_length_1967_cov_5.998370.p1  ORF type:complete len:373 (+),score=133.33 NODE_3885_length_1967_cov_5.998370:786-1904(+)